MLGCVQVESRGDFMTTKKPGQNTGNSGGLFNEVKPNGGATGNYAAVADNKPLPPTSKPGSSWKLVVKTPNSKR